MTDLLILGLMLSFSFFFSGTETAFFSLSILEQEKLKTLVRPGRRRLIERLLSSPEEILVTILIGNTLVNILASFLGGVIGERLFPEETKLYTILGMTALLLFIGEVTPKNLAVRIAPVFARAAALPLYLFFLVFTPLRRFFSLFSRLTAFLFPSPLPAARSSRRGLILSAVRIGLKEGIVDPGELSLFESFFDFRHRDASEVMIPRALLMGFEVHTRISSILADEGWWKRTADLSLLPVYRRDLDHILGYVYLRDFLPYRFGLKKEERLHRLIKPAVSVPSTKNCAELMLEMRTAGVEMAVVIDEFGGTAGIITFQSLTEEILGHFYPSREEVEEISPGWYRVPGSLELSELAALIRTDLPEEARTVAGLIIRHTGEIPTEGTILKLGEAQFTVRRTDRRRILEVVVGPSP